MYHTFNKASAFDWMRKFGINRIEMSFSGGNDEGGIDDVAFCIEGQTYTMPYDVFNDIATQAAKHGLDFDEPIDVGGYSVLLTFDGKGDFVTISCPYWQIKMWSVTWESMMIRFSHEAYRKDNVLHKRVWRKLDDLRHRLLYLLGK